MYFCSTYVQTKGRQFEPFMVSVLFDGTGFTKKYIEWPVMRDDFAATIAAISSF